MSIKQRVFLSILFLFALIGLLYQMSLNPLKIVAMFLLTGLVLFIVKKFAIDPAYGKKTFPSPRRLNGEKKNKKIRTQRPYPFKVIEGHKNKKK